MTITIRTEPTVTLVQHSGSDASICAAARVSTEGVASIDSATETGLINYLMSHRHGSPFEHTSMTFLVETPIFVAREFMRHRAGWSYNETSARYRDLDPVFYVPHPDRGLVRTSSAARPVFDRGDNDQWDTVMHCHLDSYREAWSAYRDMREHGVASEVARSVLPVGTFTSFYATCNARSLMHFLSLRTHDPEATTVSYPQFEIEQVARRLEDHFARQFPATAITFQKNGRTAP